MTALPVAWLAINVIGFVVLLLAGLLYYDRRYKRKRSPEEESHPTPGFHSTSEVFLDPLDGIRYRVYFNPRTGQREYIREE